MKKNQIRNLIVLAAIAVVLGGLLMILNYEKNPVQLPALADCKSEEVTSLAFSNLNGTVVLERSENGWVKSDDENFPVDDNTVEQMLDVLCSTQPQAIAEDMDASQLGFTNAQASITFAYPDGIEKILIGSMNQVTGQLYVLNDETIYLTDTSLLQVFSGSLLDIAAQYEIPKPDDHECVQVQNSLGTIFLSCVGSQTGGKDGTWCVQLEDGSWVAADQTAAYNFYFLTWDMNFKSTAGYITDESQLADYGLDDPQARYTLTYGGKTFDLIFGSNLPDNTTYAMCEGSPLVYTMDTLLAQWLTQAKTEDVIATKESTSS